LILNRQNHQAYIENQFSNRFIIPKVEEDDIIILTEKPAPSKSKNNEICSSNNYINLDNLNTFSISKSIKIYLQQNQINETLFYQKILRTSFLSYKNLVDFPQEWSTLNSSFKLYFKRAYIFLNDTIEQKSLLSQEQSNNSNTIEPDETDERYNFILYDISQILIKDGYEAMNIIESVIKKLNENGLNRKILCDAVLGIPLNTLSFFCTRAQKWNEQSDYAKESVMRMCAWLHDVNGVKYLLDWKRKYYTSMFFLGKG
jgi:hypothetical protein